MRQPVLGDRLLVKNVQKSFARARRTLITHSKLHNKPNPFTNLRMDSTTSRSSASFDPYSSRISTEKDKHHIEIKDESRPKQAK